MATSKTMRDVILDFMPRLRLKRNSKGGKQCLNPFPLNVTAESSKESQQGEGKKPAIGVFTGLSVEVSKAEDIVKLYENGNYGKGSQSRSAPSVVRTGVKAIEQTTDSEPETLVLILEEAFLLAYLLEVLEIQNLDGKVMEWKELFEAGEQLNRNFLNRLAAYLYLKAKGWVIKSGSKFGADFITYKNGPEYCHGSFITYAVTFGCGIFFSSKNLKAVLRVGETANKDTLLLDVIKPMNFQMESLQSLKEILVSEIIIRRMKLTSFVQHPNVNN